MGLNSYQITDFIAIGNKSIFAIDFDGTLVEDEYPNIGMGKYDVIEIIKKIKAAGNRIILWTCRCGILLDNAVAWCKNMGLEFDAVNNNLPENIQQYGSDCRKIFAHYYIDDRAVNLLDLFRLVLDLSRIAECRI